MHAPIITGSDAEGAGEIFRVTTLDEKKPPLTEEGEVDYKQDFFGKETNLTVSGQLKQNPMQWDSGKYIRSDQHSELKTLTPLDT